MCFTLNRAASSREMNWFIVCCLLTLAFTLSTQQENCPKYGVLFEDGYTYNPEPCTKCVCIKGHFECMSFSCILPKCKGNVKPVVRKGKCCPTCPKPQNVNNSGLYPFKRS
uniref:VWFC domain-containing protein n=1 Tax=Biomphalaria glabrata TaxID=6526 RepID=A0A2C9M6L5_BIOGL